MTKSNDLSKYNNRPQSGISHWIEAMRLRTLPVSCAGVIAGCGVALANGGFNPAVAVICLVFAILAQISSNFANEYFDYRNGLDRKGRAGFRRGVTEGDISPRAMLAATILTLSAACLVGLSLIYWGGWILLPIGCVIAVFALAYSAGPYPLSHHGLGDIAVIIFFGIVPVTLTAWLQHPFPSTFTRALLPSVGVGLMAANVLIVNNYRDMEDDLAVNKRTTVVIFGRKVMATIYLMNVILGCALICGMTGSEVTDAAISYSIWSIGLLGVIAGAGIWRRMPRSSGTMLNETLKQTAILLLAVTTLTTLLTAVDYMMTNTR